jgi:uncharacterized protein YjbJ (UPF0337 family)
MNSSVVIENWNERKVKLKQKFEFLTDSDLLFEEGKKELMLNKLQVSLGKTREEIEMIIENL